MAQNKQDAVRNAKQDLAKRLNLPADEIQENSVEDTDFPDSSLGAAGGGEMAGQMISSGWRISLSAKGKNYEYRADRYQLRLANFNGKNYLVQEF